ncbi:hypothetical protein V498_03210 [Pseudogymnoascus sp. VKM F-4517 (FW-2822)]|nr:hypothetical protein V498_03210 [Pseudogymnoascus sp. VKM F-4517 (FW-2822)]
MGRFLGNLGIQLELDDTSAEDIRLYHIPQTKTLRQLLRVIFPDALALSFISNEVLVELPELPRNEHAKRLHAKPGCKTIISQTDQVVIGIFATSDCVAYGDPDIRARCCGSALVRLEKSTEAEGGLEKSGEIGGVIVGLEVGEESGSDYPEAALLCGG